MKERPGGSLSFRPLHFIWIVDCSGSMAGEGKIQALNHAIREAIPHMKSIAEDNPNAKVLVRALRFSSGAYWHIAQPIPVATFQWTDLSADGMTDMGKAFQMVAEQMHIPPMTEYALPPVLVLLSDGRPSDDYTIGLNSLMKEPWGNKAVRMAIAIGQDADDEVLQTFIGNDKIQPLQANNPEALVERIKWVSTVVLKAVSSPVSQPVGTPPTRVNVPIPAPLYKTVSADDVW